MTDEQRELATRFMPMAQTLARQAAGGWVDPEELEAEAYAALVEAAQTFQADRGVGFPIYARPRILGALRDYRRFLFQAGRGTGERELPVFKRLEVSQEIRDRVSGKRYEEPPGEGLEPVAVVESILRLLPRPQAAACRLLYVEGKTYDQAAAALGCTKGSLARLQREAMTRLRHDHAEALAG